VPFELCGTAPYAQFRAIYAGGLANISGNGQFIPENPKTYTG
jgi:hypothetical protein